ncbi:MAG: ATP-binding protein [Bacteroidota bacterium]
MKIEILGNEKEALIEVEALVQNLLSSGNITQEQFGTILIALSEAVTNAIVHGNKSDNSKKVWVEYSFVDHFVDFSITDQGEGHNFDVPKQHDFFANEYSGLSLIGFLSEGVMFNDKRNSIEIRFDVMTIHSKLVNQRSNVLQSAKNQVAKSNVSINKTQHV